MIGPRTGSLALTERQLAAALGTLAEAVTVQSADGRLRFANRAALDMLGFATLDDFLASDPATLLARYRQYRPDGTPLPAGELPGRRVLQGQSAEPQLVRWIDVTAGELRWSLVKATPLLDDDGALVGAVNVIEDVTDAADADIVRRVLDEAARTLASSLDYEQTLQHVARLAVPTLADWCAVDLLDGRGEIQQVAVAHVDPDQVRLAREFRRRYPIAPSDRAGVAAVIRKGATSLTQDVTDEMLAVIARDEEHLAVLRRVGLSSALIVPLEVTGRVIGALTLVLTDRARRFTPSDVALAEELGRRAGAAVHNARLYTERGEIAHVLQASMLPRELPEPPGWRAALRHRAAGEANEVGGDLYDIQPAGDGRWLVLVGDVVGKGVGAAALTPRIRHTIATATALTGDPRDGMTLLDRTLAAEPEPERVLCTAAAVVLEEGEGGGPARARIVCAGHPAPVLVRDGRARAVGPVGRMLGLPESEDGRAHEDVEVRRSDVLLLFTDGVTEATDGDERFGLDRLCAALEAAGPGAGAGELVDAVRDALVAFAGGEPQDDAVLLAVERV
ncbi:MAG TPA: SpoIIE family protein phosphatase [Baekduia sp.]|uniref:SpoIIE family protein phosphatase n=1 Tax=Baekduia sp. TaxID=2600305 RepID=UPI002D1DC812|nr:SpoIIE family protein phosphatase [Baekduia sp.]HMJ33759.1 SpoIIE family protein phosphatase [Baekduia sp.]